MDLRDGVVVHAVAGERDKYEPIRSVLCSSPEPLEVASALRRLGFDEIYVADLDSIEGRGSNLERALLIKRELGFKLLLDAGVEGLEDCLRLLDAEVDVVVVGTETLRSLSDLKRIVERAGRSRVVASVDLKEGRLLTRDSALSEAGDVAKVAEALASTGVGALLLLELSRVGSRAGPAFEEASRILSRVSIPLLVGGGVRGLDDLVRLRDMGVAGALVATSLHDGSLTPEDLKLLRRPLAS